MVREKKWDMPLMLALDKMSLMVARFLEENGVEPMKTKGRLQNGMDADIVLYGWLTGLDGSVTTPSGLGVTVNKSFSDVLSELDFALQLYHQGRKGQWGYAIDFTYMDLDTRTPGVTGGIDVGVKAILGEVDLTFSPRDAPVLQFLLGARVFSVEQNVTLPIGPTAKGDETLIDPVIGAQGTWDLTKHWLFRLRADIGGFGVGSELTYQAFGGFGWEFAHNWRLDFGYRLLGYDIKKGGVNWTRRYMGCLSGLVTLSEVPAG